MVRVAAILGPTIFLWGAAIGHMQNMLAGNMAPGNAGVIFYTDILLPLVGFALLWFKRSTDAACTVSGVASR